MPLVVLWLALPSAGRVLFLIALAGLGVDPYLLQEPFIPGGHEQGVATPLYSVTLLSCQCYALVGLYVLGIRQARVQETARRTPDRSP